MEEECEKVGTLISLKFKDMKFIQIYLYSDEHQRMFAFK